MPFELQYRCNCAPDGTAATGPYADWHEPLGGGRFATLEEARKRLVHDVVVNAETRSGVPVIDPTMRAVLRTRALAAPLGEDICPGLRFSHRIVEV